MFLDKRKSQLLNIVVELYITHAEPIGSKMIVESGLLPVSGATIRNEMRALEEMGFLTHPYTSAGRIPTEKGYQYYVEHLMVPQPLVKKASEHVDAVITAAEGVEKGKHLAKHIAEQTNAAVIVAFGTHSLYYTGMSFLFSQPEFAESKKTVEVSQVFDHCEQHIQGVYDLIDGRDIHVFIGEQNPMGASCGLVAAQVGENSLLMVLGPQRMDYKKSVSLINHVQSLFL